MIVENEHAHAYTRGSFLEWQDYGLLLRSSVECKFRKYKSLTVHLPFEIQHAEVSNLESGLRYINYGQSLKTIFCINLYWENAPWLNRGTWDLKYGNTDWSNVPRNIDLCLDTGHLMLGCKDKEDFLKKLSTLVGDRDTQIKFLHLHENNFRSDDHIPVPGIVIGKEIMDSLIKNREWIVEKPWS